MFNRHVAQKLVHKMLLVETMRNSHVKHLMISYQQIVFFSFKGHFASQSTAGQFSGRTRANLGIAGDSLSVPCSATR